MNERPRFSPQGEPEEEGFPSKTVSLARVRDAEKWMAEGRAYDARLEAQRLAKGAKERRQKAAKAGAP
jgi:hypothetical protein